MSQKENQSGFDLFDENATAVRGFPTAMRGYEKRAVDDYIRDMERELSDMKQRYREVMRELTAANLRHDDTDFAKLGTYTSSLLKAAESQAADLVARAQGQADAITSGAKERAAEIKRAQEQHAAQQQIVGIEELKRLRAELERQTHTELEAARAEARGLREAADQHCAMVKTDAETQAAAELQAARAQAAREVALLHDEAQVEAERIRAASAKERKEIIATLQSEQSTLRDQLATLVSAAKTHSDTLQETLAKASNDLRARHEAALAEAERIKTDAITEASALVAKAQADADERRARTEGELLKRSEVLQREQNLLRQRKEALLAQLSNLSSVANLTALEFPDDDEVEIITVSPPADDAPAAEEPAGDAQADEAHDDTGQQGDADEAKQSPDQTQKNE